jgi:type IV secretion system protein VirB10
MMTLNSGISRNMGNEKDRASAALNANNPNQAFADNVAKASAADKVVAGRMGNLNYMIAQGKIIDAVLESAINSDLPGPIRAIVSRDVFAESGRLALIPKGSRLIGTYNPSVSRGQQRVFIVWTRVIRPDGIDVMIDSPGVDQLGRAGINGFVDNKLLEAYGTAILTSLFDIGAAYGGQKALGDQQQVTTTNTDGSSTTSGTAAAQALSTSISDLGSMSRGIVQAIVDLRPTITVDQGTRVNVFVNKDLIFPPDLVQQGRMIP